MLAILTPSRAEPTPQYQTALANNVELEATILRVTGKPVDIARNELAAKAKALHPRPKYTAWIDDDAFWMAGTISRLISDLEKMPNPSKAVLSALTGRRGANQDMQAYRLTNGEHVPLPLPKQTLGANISKVDLVATHFILHRTELLDVLPERPFEVSAYSMHGEDFVFCGHVRDAGGAIYVDTTLPVFHCEGQFAYLPGAPAMRIVNGRPIPANDSTRSGHDGRSYGASVDDARIRWVEAHPGLPRANETLQLLKQIRNKQFRESN